MLDEIFNNHWTMELYMENKIRSVSCAAKAFGEQVNEKDFLIDCINIQTNPLTIRNQVKLGPKMMMLQSVPVLFNYI